eukprot:TRINITY_DN91590_c0_g1_i1.p1 TRINITY_DN91590_c0_g1~~TRINITY_DN91590_c0_g1_i1.p1  ORF type:complete len:874 (-),score=197.63 TRINITY_DN91590_c0_g1_i1:74-2650(-)
MPPGKGGFSAHAPGGVTLPGKGTGKPATRKKAHAPDMGDEDQAYFDDEPDSGAAPGFSVGPNAGSQAGSGGQASDEVDPLDAFMAEINTEIAKSGGSKSLENSMQKATAMWEDAPADDPVASYFEAYEKAEPEKPEEEDEDEELDRRKKEIEPLPAVDHSQIKYNVVQTDFYKAHAEVEQMTGQQVAQLRHDLRISATGSAIPAPVNSFAHMSQSLGKELMEAIRRHGYSQPTAIQAQAIPVALSGRDLIGIAETGSGKTVAYLLPMLVHAISQPELEKDDGPIGVVLCPTRELAVQIETETFKLNKQLRMRSVTLAGGLSKLEQFKEVKRGAEIAICNPGRLIDIVKMKGCNLRRCTYVVLDEADRMFHMGFEYQVRSIVQNVRPSRQTLLFSATFPPKIEKLARDILHYPVRITIGESGQAAANVKQFVEVLKNDDEKWGWLSKKVDGMLERGQILIFVKSISSAEELTQNFQDFLGKKTEFLHGDLDQGERMRILKALKKRAIDVLIATDVAARGLDIPSIFTVVSYDVARDIETHTHRIGRTGRAGAEGQAFTLLTSDEQNKKMAALLVENLEQANQDVSDGLKGLAMKYGPFRAAKLEGRSFTGKKKGGKAEKSSFGIGFDNGARQKETVQELAKRLDQEADRMAILNRQKMNGGGMRGRGRGFGLMAKSGFVAAATEDKPAPPPTAVKPADDDSSDEDLFAPGVSAAFGRPVAPPQTTPMQPAVASRPGALLQQHSIQAQTQQQTLELQRAAADASRQLQAQQSQQQSLQLQQAAAEASRQLQAAAQKVSAVAPAHSMSSARPPSPSARRGFSDGPASFPRRGSRSRSRGRRSRSRGRRSRSRGRRRRRSSS